MNKYVESDSDSDDDDDDIDIHEIVRSGTFDDVKEAIAIDRPRLIALKDEYERTAMHYAAELNRIKVAVFLLAKQANVNAKDDKDQTPLHLASKKGFTEMVRTLLEFNADIKLRDKNCRTCLHLAVEDNFLETATILVKRGVDLNAEEYRHGRTALHIAAEKGYSEMVTMLLIRGADMYAAGDQFYSLTPLHLACIQGHTEVTRILVKRGADVAVLSGFHDKNPLHLACEHGHRDCVEIILSKNIDLDLCGNHINGSTALHICAQLNKLAILQLLVEKGSNMEKLGRFLTVGTPLHVACTYGHAHAANLLLSLGADINSRDETAHTPLHYACKTYNYDCAFMLVDLEADATARADNGKLAFDYIAIPTIKERMQNLLVEVNRRIEDRLEAERAAALAEEKRLRQEAERLERLRLAEEERIRQEIMRKAAFTKALRSVADISGEVSALIGVAEEFPEQDINVNIICPRTEYKSDSFQYSEENEYEVDSLTGTVHSHTTVGTSYGVYQLINTLYDSSALTRASLRGFADIIKALLQWPGVNLNYQESNGNTALHNAALIGNREIVEMLLLAGAKLTLFNHEGKVAANLAKTSYLREVIRNPALIQNRMQYQERVLDHLFLQHKCKEGMTLSLAEASAVNTIVEYNPPPKQGNPNKTHALVSASTGNLADLAASSAVGEEEMRDSHSRRQSKYYRPPKKKENTANARSVGSSPLRSILKNNSSNSSRPNNGENTQVAPLLVFTPEQVPSELVHLFPMQSSPPGSSSGGRRGMAIPAYALQSGVPASPLLQPASQGTSNSNYSPYPTSFSQPLLSVDSPAINTVASKYGPVPPAFGGCNSDFFFLHSVSKRGDYLHGPSAASSPFLDLLTLQRGYVPSAFDSTEDWTEVKDFLWLLGFPYKPTLRMREDSSDSNQTSPVNACVDDVSTDRRPMLYMIAVIMNNIQATFTDSENQVRQSHNAKQSQTPTILLPTESLKLPPIGSGLGGKNQQLPARAVMPSPVALIKKALLTVETQGNHDCFTNSPLPSPSSVLGPNFDWARIPSNISQTDVLRLVRFAQHCEDYVLQVLQLYAPETVGWPNEMHDSVGSCIMENIRYNVQYMRYYQLVPAGIEEQLLTLIDLSYTAVFVDAFTSATTTAAAKPQHRKVGFVCDSDPSNKAESHPESHTEDHPNSIRDPGNATGKLPDLLHNPPRHWRRAVDAVYEVSEFIKIRSEASYPLDAVRAHLWAHAGRAALQQQRSMLMLRTQAQEATPTETPLLLSPTAASVALTALPTPTPTATRTAAALTTHTPLRRWLAELLLSEYESYFQHQGFRCLGDFVGLTEQDCSDYFPFLKAGDLRRLTRAAPLLTETDVKKYSFEEC